MLFNYIWAQKNDWPNGILGLTEFKVLNYGDSSSPYRALLVIDLLFLYIIYLNGLIYSLGDMAQLIRDDGAVPRKRWLYILCGAMTILSGYLMGAPMLISPESAAAIKDGAKTGLSAVVCGMLFLVSTFFIPVFTAVPAAGIAPILIMLGALLFQNVTKLDWHDNQQNTVAFIVLFFIPFTYSVIQGVIIGYVVHISVGLMTGSLFTDFIYMKNIYFPQYATDAANTSTLPDTETNYSKKESSLVSMSISSDCCIESNLEEKLQVLGEDDKVRYDSCSKATAAVTNQIHAATADPQETA